MTTYLLSGYCPDSENDFLRMVSGVYTDYEEANQCFNELISDTEEALPVLNEIENAFYTEATEVSKGKNNIILRKEFTCKVYADLTNEVALKLFKNMSGVSFIDNKSETASLTNGISIKPLYTRMPFYVAKFNILKVELD